jgi:sterol 24-C-methyltransferase
VSVAFSTLSKIGFLTIPFTMAPTALPEEASRDADFVKLMHGKSAEQGNAFFSMLKKDNEAHRLVTDDYLKLWEADSKATDKTEEAREARKANYMSLVNG